MSSQKTALITGAGSGIGREAAISLAGEGYAVACNDIRNDPQNTDSGLYEVKRQIEASGGRFLAVPGDAASLPVHQDILKSVLDTYGRIDVLFNNAGVAPQKRLDILDSTPESYDRVMNINTRGPFFLTRLVAVQMIRQVQSDLEGNPCIIFNSSISAEVSSPSRAEYCLSKAALSQASRIYADRLAEFGINVYEIRPGIIRTGMTEQVREKYDRLIAEGLVPQKRWGTPEDIGKAVAALARGDFAFSTGLILEISGGMNIRRL